MIKFTMLDLSTSHLTKGTLQKMDDGCEFDEVIYYPKWDDFHQGNIGYFIHINEEIFRYDEEDLSELKRDGLPEDLLNIVLLPERTVVTGSILTAMGISLQNCLYCMTMRHNTNNKGSMGRFGTP